MASVQCALGCGLPVNPHDQQTWKEVTGWVGGPKKDSMRARKETGNYAHHHCVQALRGGQDPAQVTLFDEERPDPEPTLSISPDDDTREFFGE